jgi:hypothetical protein
VEPIVDLAPGTEDNPLAAALANRVRDSVARPEKRADFRALRGSVLMVAQDTTDAATLRFDHGRLTVHDGSVGIPALTLCGDEDALLSLERVPLTRLFKLPLAAPRDAAGGAVLRDLVGRYARGELKIYGLLAHPRLLLRLVRVLSRR